MGAERVAHPGAGALRGEQGVDVGIGEHAGALVGHLFSVAAPHEAAPGRGVHGTSPDPPWPRPGALEFRVVKGIESTGTNR